MVDVSLYSLVLFVHVMAGIALVGSSILAPRLVAVIRAARQTSELRKWLDIEHWLTKQNPAAAMVVLASGVYLGAAGWWMQAWFYVALGGWLANTLIATLVVERTTESMRRLVIGAGDAPIETQIDDIRWSAKWSLAIGALLANDAALLYLMFTKPNLAGAIAVVITANVVLLAVSLVARSRRRRFGAAEVTVSRGVA